MSVIDERIRIVAADADAMERPPITAVLGTAGLAFAFLVFVLAVVNYSQPLPFMPISWHANRPLWYLMAFASLVGGFALLRSEGRGTRAEQREGQPLFQGVVLYTRKGCHLCDEAFDALQRFREYLPAVETVDIDADPSLAAKFDTCVPVVEIDGKIRFRGRVNPVLLQRMIDVELSRR